MQRLILKRSADLLKGILDAEIKSQIIIPDSGVDSTLDLQRLRTPARTYEATYGVDQVVINHASVLAVGDLYQIQPVGDRPLYNSDSGRVYELTHLGPSSS